MSVSVIIPCFNHAHTLERAVVSALGQSGVSEVIVVDDASSDHSLDRAHGLAASDARVRVVSQPENQGPGAGRNRGVREACSTYVCFLDADDELMGDFIGTGLRLLQEKPELVVAKCEMEYFDPVKGYILPELDPRHPSATLSSSCGMLIRREQFLRLGGFSEAPAFRGPSGGEDVAFMRAVMAHFQPIARVAQPGYRVWSQAGSHVDRFLAHTRLTAAGGFEFVGERNSSVQADTLEKAIAYYLERVSLSAVNVSSIL